MHYALVALLGVLVAVILGWCPAGVDAQDVEVLFRQVNPSVVVIKAKGRDVTTKGIVNFSEIGSGVLISSDGKVMTAAHVVHAMDEIIVEFLGVGEAVPAHLIASEPEADLSMLQLERVPAGVQVARLGDSDRVQVGHQVLVIGAPYGLSHSFSGGLDQCQVAAQHGVSVDAARRVLSNDGHDQHREFRWSHVQHVR